MSRRVLTHKRIENRMREPFRIAGYQFDSMPSVVASIEQDGVAGRGEAAGVYYLHDDPAHMAAEIERVRDAIEAGAGRAELQELLPPGGARNALDCALWDLEARLTGQPVWRIAGLDAARPLVTTFTLPADTPEEILDRLAGFPPVEAIKLKLDGDLPADIARMRAVRRARPDVWLGVDANQGYSAESFEALAAALVEAGVALLEQPVRRGEEAQLDGWRCPIPVAADESILDCVELDRHRHRFDVVNIKLDKCGGLTEALRMVDLARRIGVRLMVGNMAGSSLAMAPAFVVGQYCEIVDLDGAWFLSEDTVAAAMYDAGTCRVPQGFWGGL
ncbi:dipeptide epimerase [Rhizorhabdus wittichii]|uniref:Dipeptide epimerase n=2 Tax=Rhizorhabdus wittichii TaxID=160791 RepID=A0A9J9HGC2_RHIWR|nr:dipeptide epimerase [Rhizorhabdus wittichii]ABQ70947.1 Mandelate racemase/muconate lactonizing enzyme, C-terminal domain protein [Rhizorhabdus wittichii RW1]ARR52333.1 dipeptide epimerase [Rhizorhabdus wittichii DC-6]QTH23567.1 dipeptide epimerase [Rhizorhabdus wittichii]